MISIIFGILANIIGALCVGWAGWTWRDGDERDALGAAIFGACVMAAGHALLLWWAS